MIYCEIRNLYDRIVFYLDIRAVMRSITHYSVCIGSYFCIIHQYQSCIVNAFRLSTDEYAGTGRTLDTVVTKSFYYGFAAYSNIGPRHYLYRIDFIGQILIINSRRNGRIDNIYTTIV